MLLIILLIILLGGGFGYHRYGYGTYGFGGYIPLIILVIVLYWLFGAGGLRSL
jgi:hypothetical protein